MRDSKTVLRKNLLQLKRRAVPASIRDVDRPGSPSLRSHNRSGRTAGYIGAKPPSWPRRDALFRQQGRLAKRFAAALLMKGCRGIGSHLNTSIRTHEGRVALVTGAAQAIGQAIALALAERGAK
jgi:hypothetical protein